MIRKIRSRPDRILHPWFRRRRVLLRPGGARGAGLGQGRPAGLLRPRPLRAVGCLHRAVHARPTRRDPGRAVAAHALVGAAARGALVRSRDLVGSAVVSTARLLCHPSFNAVADAAGAHRADALDRPRRPRRRADARAVAVGVAGAGGAVGMLV